MQARKSRRPRNAAPPDKTKPTATRRREIEKRPTKSRKIETGEIETRQANARAATPDSAPRASRRSNRDRSEATRAALIDAARALFAATPYADCGTPEIVAAAGVTRGALYHHFADKTDLYRAVIDAEAATVAAEIERAATANLAPRDALVKGGNAYLKAMAQPGRTRLLLIDGPAVLGRSEMDAIDARHGGRTLREGLAAALRGREGLAAALRGREGLAAALRGRERLAAALRGTRPNARTLDALAALLGAMYDRAALAIDAGARAADYRTAIAALIDGLLAGET